MTKTGRKAIVLRDVKADEVPWLNRTFKKGEELYEFKGHTYGCIDRSKGAALCEHLREDSFFEFPFDAFEFVPTPIEIPNDGWQLNGVGPKIHSIGDYSDMFVAFGTHDKSEFLHSCIAFAQQVQGESLEDLVAEDVEYYQVKFQIEDGDEWSVSWAEGIETNCELTFLRASS